MQEKKQTVDRYFYENKLWSENFERVMGLDEVGRGCLCGPVVAAGVILKPGVELDYRIADSKSIKETIRIELSEYIKKNAIFWTIQSCSVSEIDELNILHASLKAMNRCADAKGASPDYLLVDGNRYTDTLIPHKCIVKGDDRSVTIAAASILAKVYRDNYMKKLHDQYPFFGWNKNVGYPTKEHFKGLEEHGYTIHHRRSFKLRTEKPYKHRR
jgi:ribonuclease HII